MIHAGMVQRVLIPLLVAAALVWGVHKLRKRLRRGWWKYRAVPQAGAAEAALVGIFVSAAPAAQRYTALIDYFIGGFLRHASPQHARVHYAGAGSTGGYALNGLEGFARTAPLLAAWLQHRDPVWTDSQGLRIDLAQFLKTGLLAGTDPRSGEYWGAIRPMDQRIVEAADIARLVWLTRAHIWDQLNEPQRQQIARWLMGAHQAATPRTNWMLFPVVVNLVLAALLTDQAQVHALRAEARRVFADYRQFYRERGWFEDSHHGHGTDFYNAWGITYELYWIHHVDPGFDPAFLVAAIAASSELTAHLISPAGLPLIGRSVCYRTAVPVPLLAASLLGHEQPGRALHAMDVVWRHFLAHDSVRDGALTQGYHGTDLRWLDAYSGTGSSHWGLRPLILALLHPPQSRFWDSHPLPLPVEAGSYVIDLPGLGWRVQGHRDTGEIRIEVLANNETKNEARPYTAGIRLRERLAGRPYRPDNHAVKYGRRSYSTARPFPLD